MSFDIDCLVSVHGIHNDGTVKASGIGTGETGVAIRGPLHRGPDSVAIAQVDVVAHADLVTIIDDGCPREGKQNAIHQFNAAAVVIH